MRSYWSVLAILLLILDVSTATPVVKPSDAALSRTLARCIELDRIGDGRDCFQELEQELERGQLDGAALFRALDRLTTCDEQAMGSAARLYSTWLWTHWIPEAKPLILRCMGAGSAIAWSHGGTLFGAHNYGGDPSRLSAAEWSKLHAACVAKRRYECIGFVGVPELDARFGSRRAERAWLDGFDDGVGWHGAAFMAGSAACDLGDALEPLDPARSPYWNLGHALRCVRARADRAALVALLARTIDYSQPDDLVIDALEVLRTRPELAKEPSIAAATRRCADHASPRHPCWGLAR